MIQLSDTQPDIVGLDELRRIVREICEPRQVSRVMLLGSHAKNQAGAQSDIDLLIDFDPQARTGLLEMGQIQDMLEQKLGKRVDLVSLKTIEQSDNPYRQRSILEQLVMIYARFSQTDPSISGSGQQTCVSCQC